MKGKIVKSISITLCMILLLNFIIPNMTYEIFATPQQDQEQAIMDSSDSGIGGIADGVVGILTYPLRILLVVFGEIVRSIVGGIASAAGGNFDIDIRTRRYFI